MKALKLEFEKRYHSNASQIVSFYLEIFVLHGHKYYALRIEDCISFVYNILENNFEKQNTFKQICSHVM